VTTSLPTLIRLRGIQNQTRKLFSAMSDIEYRLQYHPDLSPAGWYLGHGLFIENYWLHEVIQNDLQFTNDKSLWFAGHCPLAGRGPRLPKLDKLLNKISTQQDNNDLFLMEKTALISNHLLFKDEYIENFIIQHYARHYESIFMVLNQIALKKHKRNKEKLFIPKTPLTAQALIKNMTFIKSGSYPIGGEWPFSFDIELPSHNVQINDFSIANTPVTNGQYLLFMHEGGYNKKHLWSDAGWQWCEKNNIQHPEYWQKNARDQWHGVNHLGPYDLNTNEAVYGISHYEATAFANWAGARLPHEHEWETAARLELIKCTTQVWEWCSNSFELYPGFKEFPYDLDLQPKFNNQHVVLKGASQYTRPEIKRAAFRNPHLPDQRHIFAGLRLVFE